MVILNFLFSEENSIYYESLLNQAFAICRIASGTKPWHNETVSLEKLWVA